MSVSSPGIYFGGVLGPCGNHRAFCYLGFTMMRDGVKTRIRITPWVIVILMGDETSNSSLKRDVTYGDRIQVMS